MTFEIVTVPCLSDNYAFLVHSDGKTALVDAPDPGPIVAALEERGWSLDEIWLTHHHWDHIDGVPDLREKYAPALRGARNDAHRLPELDHVYGDGDTFTFQGAEVQVIDVPGHTVGHIAFILPKAKAAFTADSLMALGCGRLFEGTPDQMWDSLSKLAALPADTVIYSGHEYTASNARFAMTIEPENIALQQRQADIEAARAEGKPTIPSLLSLELETNPFLRAGLQSVKSALNMSNQSDAAVFGEIRRRKDSF